MTSDLFDINYIVSRSANLWHFISNLTDWHYSAMLYKETWLKETGSLSTQEKQVLNKLKKTLQKYTFGPNYWGRIFLVEPESSIWQKAGKMMLPKEIEVFKLAKTILLPRFEKIWVRDKHLLNYWAILCKQTDNLNLYLKMVKNLNVFLGTKIFPQKIKVILLLSTEGYANGGANFAPGIITLEIGISSGISLHAKLVLWHELIHSIWGHITDNDKLRNFIERQKECFTLPEAFRKRPLVNLINESIIGSLLPDGFLAKKYFGYNSEDYYQRELEYFSAKKELNMGYWLAFSGNKLMPLTQQYIEENKSINEEYIKQVLKILKQFLSL